LTFLYNHREASAAMETSQLALRRGAPSSRIAEEQRTVFDETCSKAVPTPFSRNQHHRNPAEGISIGKGGVGCDQPVTN
jgi:hypothetical protein